MATASERRGLQVEDARPAAPQRRSIAVLQWARRHRYLVGGAAVCAAALGVNASWVAQDRHDASWDQAFYLDGVIHEVQNLRTGGLGSYLWGLRPVGVGRPPLLTVAETPFTFLLGNSVPAALLLYLLLWPVLLVSVGVAARRLFDARTGVLAMVLTATIPMLTGLSHELLRDFFLAVAATAAVAILLRSDYYERRGMSIWLGVVLGLGWLTKVTLPFVIIGPLLLCTGRAVHLAVADIRARRAAAARRRLVNVGLATVIALAIGLLWYIPAWSVTIDYVNSGLGSGDEGFSSISLHHLSAIPTFTLDIVNNGLGWFIALAMLCSLVLVVLWRLPMLIRTLPRSDDVFRVAVATSWFVVPIVAVALARIQSERYAVAAMPAAAVCCSALLLAIRPALIRRAMVGVTCVLCVAQGAWLTEPLPDIPGLPTSTTAATPASDAFIALNGFPAGSAQRPQPSAMAPVMAYLRSRTNDQRVWNIGVLSDERYLNVNTLTYLADANGDRFNVSYVFAQPTDRLRAQLQGLDFAVYIPGGPCCSPNDPAFASHVMTTDLYALFRRSVSFQLITGRTVVVLDRAPSN